MTEAQKDELQKALQALAMLLTRHSGDHDGPLVEMFIESATDEAWEEAPKLFHIRVFLEEIAKDFRLNV